uniref:non-specific serine/threonine protein kinase n=1 Tax=Echinococcus canadensis TaxID=519352 RepID=A0A915EY68_9CEST
MVCRPIGQICPMELSQSSLISDSQYECSSSTVCFTPRAGDFVDWCDASRSEGASGVSSIDMTSTNANMHSCREGEMEEWWEHENQFSCGLNRALSETGVSCSSSDEESDGFGEQNGERNCRESSSRLRSSETAYHLLVKMAHQQRPLSFRHIFTQERIENVVKMGVGTYSKVFTFRNENTVVKLIPIEGGLNFQGRQQMRASDVLPEVIAMRAVSQLDTCPALVPLSDRSNTHNFVHLQRVGVLQGSLPSYLLSACKQLQSVEKSARIETNAFPKTQKWVALECDYCGDVISDKLPSCLQARLSIFCQTALALAVAERRLRFEHRDLHCGNVLMSCVEGMRECENEAPSSTLDGVVYRPCGGPLASIIDFTFSRLDHNQAPLFSDMSKVCEGARTSEHPIDIIYSQMQEELGNHWGQYRPRTNCLWLNLISLWLWKASKGPPCNIHPDTDAKLKWSIILHLLMNSQSAADFPNFLHRSSFDDPQHSISLVPEFGRSISTPTKAYDGFRRRMITEIKW